MAAPWVGTERQTCGLTINKWGITRDFMGQYPSINGELHGITWDLMGLSDFVGWI
jgi:hypothetical protein